MKSLAVEFLRRARTAGYCIASVMLTATPLAAQWVVMPTATPTIELNRQNLQNGRNGPPVDAPQGGYFQPNGKPINVVWDPIEQVYFAADQTAWDTPFDPRSGMTATQVYVFGNEALAGSPTGCRPFCGPEGDPNPVWRPVFGGKVKGTTNEPFFHASSLIWNPNAPDMRAEPGQPWWVTGQVDAGLLNLEAVRAARAGSPCVSTGPYGGGAVYTIPFGGEGSSPFDAGLLSQGGCSWGVPYPVPGTAPQKIEQFHGELATRYGTRINYDPVGNDWIASASPNEALIWERDGLESDAVSIYFECSLASGGDCGGAGSLLAPGNMVYDSFFEVFINIDSRSNTADVYRRDGTYMGSSFLPGLDFSDPRAWESVSAANGQVFAFDWNANAWKGFEIMAAPVVTPEPTSLALMATGLAALFAGGRRKRIV